MPIRLSDGASGAGARARGFPYEVYEDSDFKSGGAVTTLEAGAPLGMLLSITNPLTSTSTGGGGNVTHDFEADRGYKASAGTVYCDGTGNILVSYSAVSSDFGDQLTLMSSEQLNLDGATISQIRITHSSDSAYRIYLR